MVESWAVWATTRRGHVPHMSVPSTSVVHCSSRHAFSFLCNFCAALLVMECVMGPKLTWRADHAPRVHLLGLTDPEEAVP